MSFSVLSLLALAAVTTYVTAHHALLSLRMRGAPVHRTVTAFGAVTLALLGARGLHVTYAAGSMPAWAMRAEIACAFVLLALAAVVVDQLVDGAPRPTTRAYVVPTAGALAFLAATTRLFTDDLGTPFTDALGQTYGWVALKPPAFVAMTAATAYTVVLALRVLRAPALARRTRWLMAVGLFGFVVVSVHDALFAARVIRGIVWFEYGFIGMLVAIDMLLLDRVVEMNAGLDEAVRDRTRELDRLNDRLAAALHQAEQAGKERSRFVARMSHELRTPLNGVLGMAHLLRRAALQDDQRTRVEAIVKSGGELLRIVDDVLDFASFDLDSLDSHASPVDLRDTLAPLVEAIAEQAPRPELSVSTVIDDTVPSYVLLDRARFETIVLQLVSNAMKFTPRGEVKVLLKYRTGHLEVRVDDTGIGMDRYQQARVFEPFHQADTSSTRTYGGTGLGLALVRRSVEAMGGRIEVSSEPNVGSSFKVSVPAVPVTDEVSRAMSISRVSLMPTTEARTIVLVVEDVDINRMVLGGFLQEAGCEVRYAAHGQEALDAIARDGAPDLVLMDLQMPELDGYEATRRIRAREAESGEHMPIVAVTAHAIESERRAAFQAGVDAFVTKPVDLGALQAALRATLGARAPRLRLPTDAPTR